MIRGFVNEKLVPIVPVGVKKLDGDWQKLDILLDTGSEVDCMLAETTVGQYGIAIRHRYDSPVSVGSVQILGNSILRSHYWVELLLEGNPMVVEAQILQMRHFSGVIGPSILLDRRVSIDVVKNGVVEIDRIPGPRGLARIRSLMARPKPQWPSLEYHWKLPWANLKLRDSKGEWHPLTVNVDTGDNGQLSLPPSLIERFGLRLPGQCRVDTFDGPLDASRGGVEILWQGKPRTVECIQSQEKNPPLVGMELLRGNRITIDVDYLPAPTVRIAPISGLVSSINNFLKSSSDRLRHRFAGRSRPRK